jgi:hypothetical protein
MRAKSDWERVRSPHARFLEGLQSAVANHPSTSARVGAKVDASAGRAKTRLTVVDSPLDNVITLPTDRSARGRRPRPRRGGGDSPAA